MHMDSLTNLFPKVVSNKVSIKLSIDYFISSEWNCSKWKDPSMFVFCFNCKKYRIEGLRKLTMKRGEEREASTRDEDN